MSSITLCSSLRSQFRQHNLQELSLFHLLIDCSEDHAFNTCCLIRKPVLQRSLNALLRVVRQATV